MLQFPVSKITAVYNITARTWETRETNGTNWDVGGHGVLGKINIVGAISDDRFYQLSLNHYKDGDFDLMRKRRTQVIHANDYRLDYFEFIIDFDPGVGLVSGPGEDPLCNLRFSNDNGSTWSDILQASIGKIGEHDNRARFTRLGAGRNRVWEFWVADPVPVVIKGAYARIEVLND